MDISLIPPGKRLVTMILPRGMGIAAAVLLAGFGISSAPAQDTGGLPGLHEEIAIKLAKDLKVKAPSGKYVAVLDNRLEDPNTDAPKVQDHHNGWLDLTTGEVEGNLVKVKGKYYVPSSTEIPPTGLRFVLRKRIPGGLDVFGDKTLEVDQVTDQWIDFEIEVPVDEAKDPVKGNFSLNLSAIPFAGPMYFDNVQVTDRQGNELWEYPEFEAEQ